MKISRILSVAILGLASTASVALTSDEKLDDESRASEWWNKKVKELNEKNNLTSAGTVIINYNHKGRENLPFTSYQANSALEYISPPNIYVESGRIKNAFYKSYFSQLTNPIRLMEKKLPEAFISSVDTNFPITYFGKENLNIEDFDNIWLIQCDYNVGHPKCEMVKGAIHLMLSNSIQGDMQSIALQESNPDKLYDKNGKAIYLHEFWKERPTSIKVDHNKVTYHFPITRDEWGQWDRNVSKIIQEMKNGKKILIKYEYDSGQENFKTYQSTVDLFGFSEAYDYMLWSFNQLKHEK